MCIRDSLRSSTSTAVNSWPVSSSCAFSAISTLRCRTLGLHADTSCGDDQLAVLVAVLRDRLGELELAAAAPFLPPCLARERLRGEHLADRHRAVVLVVRL